MANTVHVTNISAQTDDKEIRDFFGFCGTISDLKVNSEGATKTADVTFEKDTALKTALLLSNTLLGSNHITVAAADPGAATATTPTAAVTDFAPPSSTPDANQPNIAPEEKPRSRIFAEMLAHGYVVGDATLQKAIELDTKHNVSSRFYSTLQRLDERYHATDRAKTADQSYGLSARANSLLHGISSYFDHATGTGPGRRIALFYSAAAQQVGDIHNEAKRLADLKKQEAGGSAAKAAGLERVLGRSTTSEGEKAEAGDGTAAAAAGQTTAGEATSEKPAAPPS